MLEPEHIQAILNQHARSPRHYGVLPAPPAVSVSQVNSTCGDEVTVFVQSGAADAGTVIRFTGQACGICTASASLMCTQLHGQTLEQIRVVVARFLEFLGGNVAEAADLGDLQALAGVRLFPQRIGCATLPWKALTLAVEERVAVST